MREEQQKLVLAVVCDKPLGFVHSDKLQYLACPCSQRGVGYWRQPWEILRSLQISNIQVVKNPGQNSDGRL